MIPPREPEFEDSLAPHIHQTWKTDTVPEKWVESHDAWKGMDDFTYTLWTDEMNRELIETHYEWFLEQYDGYKYGIQRADAVRYFILHRYGGIYCDLDIAPKPDQMRAMFNFYVAQNAQLVLASSAMTRTTGGDSLTNAFMMSAPGASFWPIVWDHLQSPFQGENGWQRHLCKRVRHWDIILRTGPGLINKATRDFEANHEGVVFRIPSQFVQPSFEWDPKPFTTTDAVVRILDGGSWHSWDSAFFGHCHRAMDSSRTLMGVIIAVLIILFVWLLYLQ